MLKSYDKYRQLQMNKVIDDISKAIGQPIHKIWNAYGFILYLEIGELLKSTAYAKWGNYVIERGKWSLLMDGYWKFWKDTDLIIDSRNECRAAVDRKLESLRELSIQSFMFTDDLQITTFLFQNGVILTVEKDKQSEDIWSFVHNEKQSWITASVNGTFQYTVYT